VAPTAANRGELDPVRLRTAALSWIIVTPNVARGSWRGFLFAWRWSGDDVDAGQLVYPLMLSRIFDAAVIQVPPPVDRA
jgi:hypothetical protein